MKYRVVSITKNITDYPDSAADTAEFPELVQHVEDEQELFVIRENGKFIKASEFFYMPNAPMRFSDQEVSQPPENWPLINKRRVHLIDKKINTGELSEGEEAELAALQEIAGQVRDAAMPPLRNIIKEVMGDKLYQRSLKEGQMTSFFGLNSEGMDREQLLVLLGYVGILQRTQNRFWRQLEELEKSAMRREEIVEKLLE